MKAKIFFCKSQSPFLSNTSISMYDIPYLHMNEGVFPPNFANGQSVINTAKRPSKTQALSVPTQQDVFCYSRVFLLILRWIGDIRFVEYEGF